MASNEKTTSMTLVDMTLHINESNRDKISLTLKTLSTSLDRKNQAKRSFTDICQELERWDNLHWEPKEQKMTVYFKPIGFSALFDSFRNM